MWQTVRFTTQVRPCETRYISDEVHAELLKKWNGGPVRVQFECYLESSKRELWAVHPEDARKYELLADRICGCSIDKD